MEILQKYVVNGQSFDTIEEAQNYVDNNADAMRVKAFVEHLVSTGVKQRVSSTVTDTVEQFIQFEKNLAAAHAEALGKTSAAGATTQDSCTEIPVEDVVTATPTTETDEAPWVDDTEVVVLTVDDAMVEVDTSTDTVVVTGEEQEVKVENVEVTTEVSGEVAVTTEPSGLAGIEPTEKSKNLFAKKA